MCSLKKIVHERGMIGKGTHMKPLSTTICTLQCNNHPKQMLHKDLLVRVEPSLG